MLRTRGREFAVEIAVVVVLSSALWVLHAVWLSHDTRPPAWDMAVHQTYALNYLPNTDLAPGTRFWQFSGVYPPFVHIVIALAYGVFGLDPHSAILANVPATVLLLWGVYEIGMMLAGARAALWACVLTTLTPFLIWTSRETLLDYWLAAWVAAGLAVLLKTKAFESRRYSILLGLTCAFGMLTKWLFAGFLAGPLVYIIIRSRLWTSKHRALNLVAATGIAAGGASIWYLPNLPRLFQYFFENAQIGAREGEPPVISFQSFIYYLRLLEGYQFFALLFGLFIVSVVFVYKRGTLKDSGFLAAAILSGWLSMTLLRTKDPRFTMPLLGPMAVIIGAFIQSWKGTWISGAVKTALLILLCVQAYAINFGLTWLPQDVVLVEGYQGQLRWNWNLYLQNYFDILGPPKREDWQQDAILRRIAGDSVQRHIPATLALVPDLPRFNASNFDLFARLRGLAFRAGHPQSAINGIHSFDGFSYAVLIEGNQGWAYTVTDNLKLNEIILNNPRMFHSLDAYPLPEGATAQLYAIDWRR